jgi:hypothetical protein
MNQLMFWLLALFISLSCPAMEENAVFGQSSLAAKTATPTGRFYSTAFETRLNPSSYPGVSRAHLNSTRQPLYEACQ